mmetsp:Transcript_15517/g.44342  ORF Transcript_15517/g.44342 Transcript_15517/m.44342 type:complete len:208 (-) Transcript_15517:990-1613(-)
MRCDVCIDKTRNVHTYATAATVMQTGSLLSIVGRVHERCPPYRLAGDPPRRPCTLQVVAACDAVHIHKLTCKVQIRQYFALHGLPVDVAAPDAATGSELFFECALADHSHPMSHQPLSQPSELRFGHISPSHGRGDVAHFKQHSPQTAGDRHILQRAESAQCLHGQLILCDHKLRQHLVSTLEGPPGPVNGHCTLIGRLMQMPRGEG